MDDKKRMLKEIDEYFDNVTEDKFIEDLEKTNSFHFTEEIKFKLLDDVVGKEGFRPGHVYSYDWKEHKFVGKKVN